MLKRRITKTPASLKNILKSGKSTKKFLTCKECNDIEVEVSVDIGAVTCAYCVQRIVEPPLSTKRPAEGDKFPRGWALKTTYIHTDGRIFERGKDTGEKYVPIDPTAVVHVEKQPKKNLKKKVVSKKVGKKNPSKRKK